MLGPLGSIAAISAGHELFRQGDPADAWYRVASGVLRSCRLLSDGRRQIDSFILPGDYVGFESGRAYSSVAEAITPATVVRYSRARIDQSASEDPALGRLLLAIMLNHLGAVRGRLLQLGRMTAEERVASFLLEMLERSPREDIVDVPMSRNDIADYLALTIETVSRTLSMFKRDAIIALPDRQHVAVLDRKALDRLDRRD
jgi:CRP/FNR family nitrogen fixation transcriptional regulator